MSYIDEMRSIARNGNAKFKAAQEAAKKAQEYANMDGGKGAKEAAEDKAMKVHIAISEACEKLENRYHIFCSDVASYFAPKGADLTDDAKLLVDGLPYTLSVEELLTMYNKYVANNQTMTSMIAAYMDKHYNGVKLPGPVRTADSVRVAGETLLNYCRQAVSDPVYADHILNNDANWTKICCKDIIGGI